MMSITLTEFITRLASVIRHTQPFGKRQMIFNVGHTNRWSSVDIILTKLLDMFHGFQLGKRWAMSHTKRAALLLSIDTTNKGVNK